MRIHPSIAADPARAARRRRIRSLITEVRWTRTSRTNRLNPSWDRDDYLEHEGSLCSRLASLIPIRNH